MPSREIAVPPPPPGAMNGSRGELAQAAEQGIGRHGAMFFGQADGGQAPVFEPATSIGARPDGFPATLPASDPANRLPAEARRKLIQLRQHAEDVRAAMRSLSDARSHAIQRHTAAERRVAQLQQGRVSPDHSGLRAATAEVYAAAAEIAALNERQRRLEGRLPAILAEIEKWLADLPRTAALAPYDGSIGVPKAKSLHEAIESTRARLAAAKVELRAVRDAPRPRVEIEAELRCYTDALAAAGRPSISTGAGPVAVTFPTREHEGSVLAWSEGPISQGRSTIAFPDVPAVLAWAIGADALYERLAAAIDVDDAAALPSQDRAKREAALVEQILAIERSEEAAIERLEAETGGEFFQRRRGADPLAVLAIKIVPAAPAALVDRSAVPTSPEWNTRVAGPRG